MLWIPESFDEITLEYIQKTLPADQLEKAEDAGLFDLIKSRKRSRAGLHPERVLIHGPHGISAGIRYKKNADSNEASRTSGAGHNGRSRPKTLSKKKSKRRDERVAAIKRQILDRAMAGTSAKGRASGDRKGSSQKLSRIGTSHQAEGSINSTKGDRSTLGAPKLETRDSMLDAMRKANPHRGNSKYDDNCECCVVAYEARRRGFDVVAGRTERGRKVSLVACFKGDLKALRIQGRTAGERELDIEESMADWGNGARAYICTQLDSHKADEPSGHAFVVEQVHGRT